MTEQADLLSYADIAELTGLTVMTLRRYKREGYMPAPDVLPVPDRPRWHRATIDQWLISRPGQGAPGRPRAKRKEAPA
jgi:predicted DNA-binding transcriptional regulator AlpA